MVLGDIKEVVRTTIGKRDIEPVILNYIIESGRRDIEKENNWYYMRKSANLTLVVGQQAYTVQSGGDINEANFKDTRIYMYRHPSSNRFYEIPSGDRNQLDLQYTTTDSWAPCGYTMDDEAGVMSLLIYPPSPDLAYVTKLLYYAWSANPSADTGTDELIARWPELLIYSSIAQGYRIVTKEEELSTPWDSKMQLELAKLKRYDWFRMESERNMIQPRRGPFTGTRDITAGNLKIYV